MPTCVSRLSNKNVDRLEKIITKKYKKFIWFYRMIEAYLDGITNFHYDDESSDSEFHVILIFSEDSDLEFIKNAILDDVEEGFKQDVNLSIEAEGNQLIIRLTYDE